MRKLPMFRILYLTHNTSCDSISGVIRKHTKPGQSELQVLNDLPEACRDEAAAVEFMERQRWGDIPACPRCGCIDVKQMKDSKHNRNKRFLWRCHGCKKQFTVRVGTIMEDSRIPLKIWCHAFWRACSSKKGVSALQISRECSISYKSALFLMHRIRWAMAAPQPREKMKGIVEVDETYVGGRPRNRHPKHKRGRGTSKTPVVALIERPGNIRVKPVANVTGKTLRKAINENIDKSARLCTDDLKTYRSIGRQFAGGHGRVRHGILEYVNGQDHVNTCESFFALLKRGVYGTFHAISKKHLHRYCSEFEFSWRTRGLNDGERVVEAIKGGDGKRLTYHEPTRKTG